MTTMDVHSAEPIPEACRAEVQRLLETGDLFRYTSVDAPVTLLERDFAEMMGSRYALAVASCSAALFLSLKAVLPDGGRVAIPAFTFAAVPSAVVHAGCTPVLIESGPDLRIDIDDLGRKIHDVDAVLISHMRGHTSDMDAILRLAEAEGIPIIEDAAHSLGTTWRGRQLGTLGVIGCFSFQSYKMLNAGEGGILITDDADLVARATVMSGAYERNWAKHDLPTDALELWQNELPLYNTRLGNLSAALVRAQLPEVPRRVADGRRNHDHVADRLRTHPLFTVPAALEHELRAPDSLQFLLTGLSDGQVQPFLTAAKANGIGVQLFGGENNARAFWNWRFLGDVPDLPATRAVLMRACDVRLPARLSLAECDVVADALLAAADTVMPTTRVA